MQPSGSLFGENLIPIDITRLELRYSRMATVVGAQCCTNPEAALGEIETIPRQTAHAIMLSPMDQGLVHTTLINQILKQPPHRIIDQRCDHCCVHAEAAFQPPGDVILSTAFAHFKPSGRSNAPVARVQSEHYLAQT